MIGWIYFCTLMVIFIGVKARYEDYSDLNITEIIKKHGYPVVTHEIETEDGYLLDVYRIPYGRINRTERIKNYPVIVSHGLLGSAENFILMGPNKSLAYMLADHGFDVWLTNARGSWHSRKHRTLNPDKGPEFWRFTWHEIGIYDLPAIIDHVLNMTNRDKVHYVGHSQGTTSFFVMCSERPDYNNRIKVMVALAPAAIYRHFKHPIYKMITPFYRLLGALVDEFNAYELPIITSNKNLQIINKALCGKNHLLPYDICYAILSLLLQDTEMDKDVIPLALSTIPAGGSVKQVLHYSQNIEEGTFRKYDWGPEENMRRYNSKIPTEYNLKNATIPVAIFYGEADFLVSKEDVEILVKILPNVIKIYKVPLKTWGHYDFLWGKNIEVLLNNEIVNTITKNDYK